MGFADFFKTFGIDKVRKTKDVSSHWIRCPACGSLMYAREVARVLHVCSKCSYHFKMSAVDRLSTLCDSGTFVEFDLDLVPNDPLDFFDKKSYKKRVEEGVAKTGRPSSVISGESLICGSRVQMVIFDFAFMGGSLGSVEGEKIVRSINRSIEKRQPLVIVSASGGARMQESTYSLMQMAKTSAALGILSKERIPFFSILTNPTFGGVSASFAFLGDLIIAEPGAMVGFAGSRVIKQTIGTDLPDGFQTSEFLLDHGLIDMIVHRKDLRSTLSDLISIFMDG